MTAAHTMPEPTSVWAAPDTDSFTTPWPDPEREQRLDAEIKGIVNSLGIVWPVEEIPEPVSPYFSHPINRTLCKVKVTYRCTELPGHSGPHEARDTAGTVVATSPAPRKKTA